ncbi:MAG: hypothetical protein SFV24_08060 [Gemmatimonadales bacterium]|nr:hypothetical protein [Gemmatimonadales bacterium]
MAPGPQELARFARQLIAAAVAREGIGPGQLTVHADRGAAMTSKPVAFLLADLGITKTDAHLHVSNDNPCSEAQFKTLKYHPSFPDRFWRVRARPGLLHRLRPLVQHRS